MNDFLCIYCYILISFGRLLLLLHPFTPLMSQPKSQLIVVLTQLVLCASLVPEGTEISRLKSPEQTDKHC